MISKEKYLDSNIIYNNPFTPELLDIVRELLHKKEGSSPVD